jgi:hypothetical protein
MARPKKGEAHTSGMNKRQMVEAAMDAQGGDPGPKEIVSYLKSQYGVDMKYTMAASYKSGINRKRGGAGLNGSVDVRDMMAVKALLNRLGAAQLNSIIKLLGQ